MPVHLGSLLLLYTIVAGVLLMRAGQRTLQPTSGSKVLHAKALSRLFNPRGKLGAANEYAGLHPVG